MAAPTVLVWYGSSGSKHCGQGQQKCLEDKGHTPAILPSVDPPPPPLIPPPSCAGTSAGAE